MRIEQKYWLPPNDAPSGGGRREYRAMTHEERAQYIAEAAERLKTAIANPRNDIPAVVYEAAQVWIGVLESAEMLPKHILLMHMLNPKYPSRAVWAWVCNMANGRGHMLPLRPRLRR